jgi:hypothetical protein
VNGATGEHGTVVFLVLRLFLKLAFALPGNLDGNGVFAKKGKKKNNSCRGFLGAVFSNFFVFILDMLRFAVRSCINVGIVRN